MSKDNSYRKMETGSLSKSKGPCPVNKTMKYIGRSNGMEWYISKIFPCYCANSNKRKHFRKDQSPQVLKFICVNR